MGDHVSYSVCGKKVCAENGPEIVFSRTRDLLTPAALNSSAPTAIQGYNSSKYEAHTVVVTGERIDVNAISRKLPVTTVKSDVKPTTSKPSRSLTPDPRKVRRQNPPASKVLSEEDKQKERLRARTASKYFQQEKAQELESKELAYERQRKAREIDEQRWKAIKEQGQQRERKDVESVQHGVDPTKSTEAPSLPHRISASKSGSVSSSQMKSTKFVPHMENQFKKKTEEFLKSQPLRSQVPKLSVVHRSKISTYADDNKSKLVDEKLDVHDVTVALRASRESSHSDDEVNQFIHHSTVAPIRVPPKRRLDDDAIPSPGVVIRPRKVHDEDDSMDDFELMKKELTKKEDTVHEEEEYSEDEPDDDKKEKGDDDSEVILSADEIAAVDAEDVAPAAPVAKRPMFKRKIETKADIRRKQQEEKRLIEEKLQALDKRRKDIVTRNIKTSSATQKPTKRSDPPVPAKRSNDVEDLESARVGDAAASWQEKDWISVPIVHETAVALEQCDSPTFKMKQYSERLQSRHQLPAPMSQPAPAAPQPVRAQSTTRKSRPKSASQSKRSTSNPTRRSVTSTARRPGSSRGPTRSRSAPRASRRESTRRRVVSDDKENIYRKSNMVRHTQKEMPLDNFNDAIVNYESDNDFITVLNQDASLRETFVPRHDPSPVKVLIKKHREMDKEQHRLQREVKKLEQSEFVLGQAMQSARKNSHDALMAMQKLTKAQQQLQQLSRDLEGLTQLRESSHDPLAVVRASIASKLESIASDDIPPSMRDSYSTVASEPLCELSGGATQPIRMRPSVFHETVAVHGASPPRKESPPKRKEERRNSPVPSPQQLSPRLTGKYPSDPLLDQQLGMQRDKQEILRKLMMSSSSDHEHSDAEIHFDSTKQDMPTVRFSNSSPDIDRGTVEYDARHAQGDLIWNDKVFRLDATGGVVEVPSQHVKDVASQLSLRNAGELAGIAAFHHRSDDEESEDSASVESDGSDPNGLVSLVSRQILELQEEKRRKELEIENEKQRASLAAQMEEEYHQQRAQTEVNKDEDAVSYWDSMLLETVRDNLEVSLSVPPRGDKNVEEVVRAADEGSASAVVDTSFDLPKQVDAPAPSERRTSSPISVDASSKHKKYSGAELRLHLLNELQKMDDGFNYLLELSELEQNATVQTANDVMSRIVARAESESNRLLQIQQAEQMRHAHEMQLAATTTAAAVMAQEEKARVDAAVLELQAELQHHKMHTEQLMHVAQSSEAMSNLQHTAVLLEIEQKLQASAAPTSVTIGTNTDASVTLPAINIPPQKPLSKQDVSFQQSYAEDFESSRYSETFEAESMYHPGGKLSHVSEVVETESSVAESIPESLPENDVSASIEESYRSEIEKVSPRRHSVDESIEEYGMESYAHDSFATVEPSMSHSRLSKKLPSASMPADASFSSTSALFSEYKDQLAAQKKHQEESIELRLRILKKKLAYDLERKKSKYSDSKAFAKEKSRLLSVFNEHCAELEKEKWEVKSRFYRDLRIFGETATSSSDAIVTASTTESVNSPQRGTISSPIRSAVAAKLEASDSVLSFEVEDDLPDEISEAISEEASEGEGYSDDEFEVDKSTVAKKDSSKISTRKPGVSVASKGVPADELQQRYDALAKKRAEVEELLHHKNDDKARRLALIKIEEEEKELEAYMRRVLEMDVEAELEAYRQRAREEAKRNLHTAEMELKRAVPEKVISRKQVSTSAPVSKPTKLPPQPAKAYKADDTYENDFEEIPDEVEDESYAEEISEEAAPSILESIDEQKDSASEVISEEQHSAQEISSGSDRYNDETFERTAATVSFKESIADYADDFDEISVDRQLSEPSVVEEVHEHEVSTRSMDTIAELETSLDARRQRIDLLKQNIEKVQRDKRKLELMRAKAKEREQLLEEEAVLAQLLESEKGNYQAEKEAILEAMKQQAAIAAAAALEKQRIDAERERELKEASDAKAVDELMSELREPVEEEIAALEGEADVEGDSWASDFGNKFNIVPVVMGNEVARRVQQIESAMKLQNAFRCHLAKKHVNSLREERQRKLDEYMDTLTSETIAGDVIHESLAADVAQEIAMDDSFASSFSSSDKMPSMTEELDEKVAMMEHMVREKDQLQATLLQEETEGEVVEEVEESIDEIEVDVAEQMVQDMSMSHNEFMERLDHSRDTVAWNAPPSGRASEGSVYSDGSHTIETITTAGTLATIETAFSGNIHLEPLPVTIQREIFDESPRMKRPMTELSPVTAGVDSGGTVAGTIDTIETLESDESFDEYEIQADKQTEDVKYDDIVVAGDESEEEYTIEAYDDEFESFAAGDNDVESMEESIPESIPEDTSVDAPLLTSIPQLSSNVKVSPPEKHREVSQDSILDASDDIPADDSHTLESMGDVVQEARKPSTSFIRDDEWSQSGDVPAPAETIVIPSKPIQVVEANVEEEIVIVKDIQEEEEEVTPVVTPAATPGTTHRSFTEQPESYSDDEICYFSDKDATDVLVESEEIPEESMAESFSTDDHKNRSSIMDTAISPMNVEESDVEQEEQNAEEIDEGLVDRITDAILQRMLEQESVELSRTMKKSQTVAADSEAVISSPALTPTSPPISSPMKVTSPEDRPLTIDSPPQSPRQSSPKSPEEYKKTLSSLSDAPALFGAKAVAKEAVSPPSAAVSAVADKIYAAAEETPQETWNRVTQEYVRDFFHNSKVVPLIIQKLSEPVPNEEMFFASGMFRELEKSLHKHKHRHSHDSTGPMRRAAFDRINDILTALHRSRYNTDNGENAHRLSLFSKHILSRHLPLTKEHIVAYVERQMAVSPSDGVDVTSLDIVHRHIEEKLRQKCDWIAEIILARLLLDSVKYVEHLE